MHRTLTSAAAFLLLLLLMLLQRHLEQLAGYGEDHMLVTKARGLLHAEKEAAAVASSGS